MIKRTGNYSEDLSCALLGDLAAKTKLPAGAVAGIASSSAAPLLLADSETMVFFGADGSAYSRGNTTHWAARAHQLPPGVGAVAGTFKVFTTSDSFGGVSSFTYLYVLGTDEMIYGDRGNGFELSNAQP